MDLEVGKDALSKEGYRWLCLQFFTRLKEGRFAHLFQVMTWNLIARGCSTAHLNYSGMHWSDDCLVVKLGGKQKGDQVSYYYYYYYYYYYFDSLIH